jgi:hypothetical protein
MSEKIYIFDMTRGDGVPGLPHEVTEAQAQALGLLHEFKEAVDHGLYKPVKTAKEKING